MKTTIENINTVNHKLYIILFIISTIGIIMGQCISILQKLEIVSGIIINISYGCFASTVVSWIIEWNNVKRENVRMNRIYDEVYIDLQYKIQAYIEEWSGICSVAFGDGAYEDKQHTWFEWYEITKTQFEKCPEELKEYFMYFFSNQMKYVVNETNKAIKRVTEEL